MFKRKTVASVLGQFHKAVADLEEVVEYNSQKAQNITEEIGLLERRRDVARQEVQMAEDVSKNIRKLIGE